MRVVRSDPPDERVGRSIDLDAWEIVKRDLAPAAFVEGKYTLVASSRIGPDELS
jgi:hypothetical protein